MTTGIRTVIYPVNDIDRAKEFFAVLTGAGPVVDAPYYVQFDAEGQNIGLDPHGHRFGQNGPVAYWPADDVAKSLAALVEAGAEVVQEPTDVGGGMRIAVARDADGNLIGLRPGGLRTGGAARTAAGSALRRTNGSHAAGHAAPSSLPAAVRCSQPRSRPPR